MEPNYGAVPSHQGNDLISCSPNQRAYRGTDWNRTPKQFLKTLVCATTVNMVICYLNLGVQGYSGSRLWDV
jgi:hypothetical protein